MVQDIYEPLNLKIPQYPLLLEYLSDSDQLNSATKKLVNLNNIEVTYLLPQKRDQNLGLYQFGDARMHPMRL